MPNPLVLLVAAVAGAATMAVELSAVRLLAPWFGTSQAVWTNVIAVVLLALALGYLLGARLSRRAQPERALAWVLASAALSAALVPFAAPPVARLFLPEGLTLDEAAALLRWGSLATAALLFLPPALALGCVSPLCTELVDRRRTAGAGSAAGRVLCVGTLGSLVGTFGATHLLVPEFGLTRSFLCAAVALALCALSAGWRGGARASGASLVLVLALVPVGEARRPLPPAGSELLAAQESAYQSVRVVRTGTGADERRELQVNEAFDSFQSLWIPRSGPLGEGAYYDAFALPAWWGRRPGAWNVCVLGLGAGTAWRVIEGSLPPGMTLSAVGVEIDPVVVELGARWMDLAAGPERQVLSGWDARAALRALERRFDLIVLDAYANQMEIPAHLATREFFELVGARLAPQGWVLINVGAFGLDDPVLEALAGAATDGLQAQALALRVPFSRNVVLVLRPNGPLPVPGPLELPPDLGQLARLAARWSVPALVRRIAPGECAAPSDERCDIERRQLESLARARAAWESP